MIRGFYTAASGMIYENMRQENIGQNLSNIETPGFKQTLLTSSADYATMTTQNQSHVLGTMGWRTGLNEAHFMQVQGAVIPTERTLDLGITGNAYFVVQDETGETFITRNGQFGVNANNELVTQFGHQVLSTEGTPIPVDEATFSVDLQGNFTSTAGTGQLLTMGVAAGSYLESIGNSLYELPAEAERVEVVDTTITQGALEQSNVDPLEEMTNMLSTNRAFSMNAQALQMIDESIHLAVTELGRV